MTPKLFSHAWKIVRVNRPILFHRTADEMWLINPQRRYIMTADQAAKVEEYIDTCSDLESAELYRPLRAGKNINGSTILVERVRDRGIGDLLFLTGPLAYMQHVTGRNVTVDLYALSDRGVVLSGNPDIRSGTVLAGPLEYDSLANYDYQWFIQNVTEWSEEPDQLNVYDALYAQLGFDPSTIEPQWKRPRVTCSESDYKDLDALFYRVYTDKNLDLRRTGYYVVAPFVSASTRAFDYRRWLEIIEALSCRRPVLVMGSLRVKMPDCGLDPGTFIESLSAMSSTVIPVMEPFNLRVQMAMISRAVALVGLDSGPLYIAQGLRTPAVSIWGTHAPKSRIGHDPAYMETAIWTSQACPHSPCFTYLDFPVRKCPGGSGQSECEVYKGVTTDLVMEKLDIIEGKRTT